MCILVSKLKSKAGEHLAMTLRGLLCRGVGSAIMSDNDDGVTLSLMRFSLAASSRHGNNSHGLRVPRGTGFGELTGIETANALVVDPNILGGYTVRLHATVLNELVLEVEG
jgi:hypothetical protein